MNDISVFYNEIINEACTGRVDCCFYMNILFSTYIKDEDKLYKAKELDGNYLIPTLNIHNKDVFNKLLTEYLNLSKEKYDLSYYIDEIKDSGISNYEQVINKLVLTNVWANATYDDFNEPEDFIRKQISFLKDETFSEYDSKTIVGYSDVLGGFIEVERINESLVNETPYSLKISVREPETNEEYTFPIVRYGIYNGKCYIYAVQKDKKYDIDNKYKKKINRKLYQIGENFDSELNPDLKDVSASFIISSNIALGLLSNKGINDIVIPSILIERWNAKERTIIEKSKRMEDDINYIESKKEEHVMIQSNLTEKLIRTFMRIVSHNNTFEVTSYPFDTDSSLHIRISDSIECNNTLLSETFNIGKENNRKI